MVSFTPRHTIFSFKLKQSANFIIQSGTNLGQKQGLRTHQAKINIIWMTEQ